MKKRAQPPQIIQAFRQVATATGQPASDPPDELFARIEPFHLQLESISLNDAQAILPILEQLNGEATVLLNPVAVELQLLLQRLGGLEFGSPAANAAMARQLQRTLSRLGFRLACPREGCGVASLLQWGTAGRVKNGTFRFEHPLPNGRLSQHAGCARLPPGLRLVALPPDRRWK